MIASVRNSIERIAGPAPGPGILAAVSGGIDSMSLLHVLRSLRYDISCIHINHEQRGAASDEDAVLVGQYCEEHDIRFVEHRIGDRLTALVPSGSIQASARRLRHQLFHETAAQFGIAHVATGHNKDDQAETVLLNLLRKTGLDGLTGMPESRPIMDTEIRLIRPMLSITRITISKYADNNAVIWSEDASNQSQKYRRNRIRYSTLPALQDTDLSLDVIDEIVDMSNAVREMIDHALGDILTRASIALDDTDPRLSIKSLQGLPDVVRSWLFLRAIRKWLPGAPARRSTVQALEKLINVSTGKKIVFQEGTVWREREHLVFVRETSAGSPGIDNGYALLPALTVERITGGVDLSNIALKPGADTVLVDAATIVGALEIRFWRDGDRFMPLGMTGTKKLKSFLTDRKVNVSARRGFLVVEDAEKIVWVVGLEIDNRVRVHPDTTEILRLSTTE